MVGQARMSDVGVAVGWHVAVDTVVLLFVASFLRLAANKRLMARFTVT